MGVRKFRSIADMPGPPPRVPLDSDNLRIAVSLMSLTHRLSRFSYVPGVRKFRSVEEADAHRRAWEQAETRRLRGDSSSDSQGQRAAGLAKSRPGH
jgi:hypothetical protein